MSATSHPKILTFLQDGSTAIAKGVAVKLGADDKHVTPCTSSTDAPIGISQGVSTLAEDEIEVNLPGGGCKGLAQGTIAQGKLLVSHTDGSLKQTTGSGDAVVGVAMQSAVAGDLFYVEGIRAVATAANQ